MFRAICWRRDGRQRLVLTTTIVVSSGLLLLPLGYLPAPLLFIMMCMVFGLQAPVHILWTLQTIWWVHEHACFLLQRSMFFFNNDRYLILFWKKINWWSYVKLFPQIWQRTVCDWTKQMGLPWKRPSEGICIVFLHSPINLVR